VVLNTNIFLIVGTVMYGHNPEAICARKMPFTYGTLLVVCILKH